MPIISEPDPVDKVLIEMGLPTHTSMSKQVGEDVWDYAEHKNYAYAPVDDLTR